MKKLEFQFTGGETPVVFVSFYKEDFKINLLKVDPDSFDQLDFLSESEAKSIWLGRGMCQEGGPKVKVFEDGVEVDTLEDDELYQFEDDPNNEEFKKMFREHFADFDPAKLLGGHYESSVDIHNDQRFFGDINRYKFATIETVETYSATASVIIEVEDDYKWTDFEVIFADIDTGGAWGDSFTQEVYRETNLENELLGLKYKGAFYPVDSDYEGGSSEWLYYECTNGNWAISTEVTEKMEELLYDW